MSFTITGNLVDVLHQKILPAALIIDKEKIVSVTPMPELKSTHYILPGFIDAHIHIESSMLVPSEFARVAVTHGTVATVSDPHEIANVCGMEGVDFMINNGNGVPFKFYFGAPSCVPATNFETAGASLDVDDINKLMSREEILYLSEMMNFPGVLHNDKAVMQKIAAAKKFNKPVDGHAPGLKGEAAEKYIKAGITTDHECFTKEEALDKLKYGMKIIIREGSAAKNFDALIELLHDYPEKIMFCSDDKHPDSLVEGHINQLCARAVAKGIDIFKVLKAASVNPVQHYNLKVGLLKPNDFADLIVVKDLQNFEVLQTYINGRLVAEKGKTLIERNYTSEVRAVNNFNCQKKEPEDFKLDGMNANDMDHSSWFRVNEEKRLDIPVIGALDGQLITNKLFASVKGEEELSSNVEDDILKIVVVNRYNDAPVAKAFIKNFGLKKGAIASSVAHDSHNIVAVGVDDESLCKAVNLIIENKGGVSCVEPIRSTEEAFVSTTQSLQVDETQNHSGLWRSEVLPSGGFKCIILPLPIAGLMSDEDGYVVAEKYSAIDKAAKELGSTLSAPYMTLSFMALLVIPHLKLSDKGLFDGDEFKFL